MKPDEDISAEELLELHLARIGKPPSRARPLSAFKSPETIVDEKMHRRLEWEKEKNENN